MKDHELEPDLHDAARAYREPPPLDHATREAMWANIHAHVQPARHGRHHWPVNPWLALAATLVIGIGIGHLASTHRGETPDAGTTTTVASTGGDHASVPPVYESPTSQYLTQTTALLLALPADAHDGKANAQFVNRAQNLLVTTRLLLDSPAAQDPRLHGLLSDLEVVLAQVVRLQYERNPVDLDLINQALQQHDVLPRLRTAAANISAD